MTITKRELSNMDIATERAERSEASEAAEQHDRHQAIQNMPGKILEGNHPAIQAHSGSICKDRMTASVATPLGLCYLCFATIVF